MNKTILLASFIFPERLEIFLNYLEERFDIPRDKVFIFENLDDPLKIMVTFKLVIKDGKRINIRKVLPNTIPIHKKGNAIYTINALNKLIEHESGLEKGNINYKDYKIDWDEYQNKLILVTNNELKLYTIKQKFS